MIIETVLGILGAVFVGVGLIAPPGYFFIAVLFGIICFAGAIIYNYMFGGYKYPVTIFEKYSGATIKKTDKAKRIRNVAGKGGFKFKLKDRKDELDPPASKYLIPTDKGKAEIILSSPAPGIYFYCTLEDNGNIKIGDNAKDEFWRATENQKDLTRFENKGFWEKYAWIMAIAIILMGFTMVSYVYLTKMGDIQNSVNGGIGALDSMAGKLITLRENIRDDILVYIKTHPDYLKTLNITTGGSPGTGPNTPPF